MALDTSAAAAAYSRLSCILLNRDPAIGIRRNKTTAVGAGRDNLTMEASFCYAQPPLASNLFVHCPGVTFPRSSIIVSTAQDLLLFRVPVAVEPPPNFFSSDDCDYVDCHYDDCDYMIYRAGRSPTLTRIPNPKPNFHDDDIGLLSRAGDLFTVAALVAKSTREFTLHRFDSEVGNWSMKTVSLAARPKPYSSRIRTYAPRLNHHITTTVITLGGKSGTMGWVDLWSGILLYDLCPEDQERPMLRHMRLPLPMDLGKWPTELGCPKSIRGIASVIKDGKPCLKLASLQLTEERLPYDDIETNMPCYRVNNWAITTWSNTMVHFDSSDNWQDDFTVWAPDVIISDTVRSKLLASGLLHRRPSEDGEETVELALQNLVVSEPTPSLNGEEEVVYLMARPKYFHPKAWALAIDMKTHTLLDVAEFGTAKEGVLPDVTYRSSAISKYLALATPPVTRKT